MARAKLVVTHDFTSFGEEFIVGDTVSVAKANGWPGETLANRLRGGFLKYEAEVDALEEADALIREAHAQAAEIIAKARANAGIDSTVPNPSTTNADHHPSDAIPGEGVPSSEEVIVSEQENGARGNPSTTNADNQPQDLAPTDEDNPDAGQATDQGDPTSEQPEEVETKSLEELEALTKSELQDYAQAKLGIALGSHLTHEKMVERITKGA